MGILEIAEIVGIVGIVEIAEIVGMTRGWLSSYVFIR